MIDILMIIIISVLITMIMIDSRETIYITMNYYCHNNINNDIDDNEDAGERMRTGSREGYITLYDIHVCVYIYIYIYIHTSYTNVIVE